MDSVADTNLSSKTYYNHIGARVFFITATSAPCCVFLFINGTMLFTLRSKPVFSESPRYVLLFNLVFADTVLLTQAQTLYLMSVFHVVILYPVCGVLTMVSFLVCQISPFTLVVMSIERYIAVCFPLRHSSIVTLRNTGFAILLIWAFSCMDILIRVLLILQFPFQDLPSLTMPDVCNVVHMFLTPAIREFNMASTCIQFVFSGIIIVSLFISIMIVACSASTDKTSVDKARKTLLLHLFQLGLTLLSTLNAPMYEAASKYSDLVMVGRLYVVIYIFVILLPRCLSTLTYGLRDQSLRPVLVARLCCLIRLTEGSVGVQVTSQRTTKVY